MRGIKNFSVKKFLSGASKGQGLIETTLLLPVLLIVLSGLIEFGFLLNDYMGLQDAARNAARYGVDSLYYLRDHDQECNTTRDFYRQIACLVNMELAQERPQIELNVGNCEDDVVISAFTISASKVSRRHPIEAGEAGWSMSADTPGLPAACQPRNEISAVPVSWVNGRLIGASPNTGLLLVEIYYLYHHKLGLPWITAVVPNPVLLHVNAIMPNSSAEPTPTPMP